MASRRSFITGLLATGLMPKPTWADAGRPAYLSAGMKPNGSYALCGLASDGRVTFELPLASRGHAAAAHPTEPVAVAFARRPGTYAVVLDCSDGSVKAQLTAPADRHFYGHGVFSPDGALLFTTENDYDKAVGVVGVWDVRNGYRRLGEFWSGGVGPHDIKLMPDGETLVVANGGIETHPEAGRIKLNLPTMRSNLSYLSLDGTVAAAMALGDEHQRNSIRHLAVSDNGDVAFAMQWQGDTLNDLPLLGVHRPDEGKPRLFEEASGRMMQGYLGSIAFNSDVDRIATTSPRRGAIQVFSSSGLISCTNMVDVCGVCVNGDDFAITTGTGIFRRLGAKGVTHQMAWDNHLIAI